MALQSSFRLEPCGCNTLGSRYDSMCCHDLPSTPSNSTQDHYLSCFSRFRRVGLYYLAFSESLSKVR
ncbi:hypothetical protein ARMSODRAFT_413800 [Armillaria solidipes]|uniref:Uncharacterized protein n=1 Tax=Armillaria solidipes TaxID=1076256 RepID=A0A2H3BYF2_9AGAR|nr:hypothetical protein ARMSODRAFT_413800 [Armillaria solidipes]